MTGPGDLRSQVDAFAQEVDELLAATLPNLPEPVVETVSHGSRYAIHLGIHGDGVPLRIKQSRLATLKARYFLRLDSVERYLAVDESSFVISADVERAPILRFDYRRDMTTAPNAHIQVHAQRGALSHLLSRAGHAAPHDMSKLHIPVGGSRFRPCLEDVLQLLLPDCRCDGLPNWQLQVDQGRELWRRRQVAAVTRDVPDEAARVLRELGFRVEAPQALAVASSEALRHW